MRTIVSGIDNIMYINRDGGCRTKLFKHGEVVGDILTDHKTAAHYKKHLARTSCLWKPNEEPPQVPHGSVGGKQELSMADEAIRLREYRAKKKRGTGHQ